MGGGGNFSVYRSSLTFTKNSADRGGAIYLYSSALHIEGFATFSSNTATGNNYGYGGAIYADSHSTVSFINSSITFIRNTASGIGQGGAIHATSGSTVTFLNSSVTFTSNTAPWIGGAIYLASSKLHIEGAATFSSNTATGFGGAIYVGYSELNIIGTATFSNNTAIGTNSGSGGAIDVSGSTVTFTNSSVTFTQNSARVYGGAIYVSGSTVTFINSSVTFTKNSAASGGAIYANTSYYGGAVISFVNSSVTFTQSSATYGGAISISSSILTISGGSIFSSNTAFGAGGAIYAAFGSTVSLTALNLTFTQNFARINGGAIYLSSSALHIEGFATFSNNNTANSSYDNGRGGAIYADSSELNIKGTATFSSNTATSYTSYGGAIYLASSKLHIEGFATFSSNTATWGGGAIYNWESTVSFVNSTVDFSYNSAGSGGAIYNWESAVSFVNSTVSFSGNTGGAIYNWEATLSFVNSTVDFSYNSAGTGGAIDNSAGSSVFFANSTVDFSYNSTTYGGAIINSGGSTVSFINSTVDFSNNSADNDVYGYDSHGGAIYNSGSTVSFDNSTVDFSGNSAYWNGGAIYNLEHSAVSFVNSSSSFVSNSAKYGGAIYSGANYSGGPSVSFTNSTVDFLGNRAVGGSGGAIYNQDATVSFTNSTVDFLGNRASAWGDYYRWEGYGGAIYNSGSIVSFVNSTVYFSNNSAEYGGAIYNDANSTLIFKGGSKVIFEENTANYHGGADIYNEGIIEIAEHSEVILRSGISGDSRAGGVVNIKSGGVLRISVDEIFINTLNVYSADSKFSLVDREAIFATVYTTKTAQIENLTVEGILEIGIDLSANNINDLFSADSITFLQGSSLQIVPFNEISSPRTYSIISTYDELRGFENLDYDHSLFVLDYDEQMKTVILKVIYHQTPDFIKAVLAANTIRQLSKFDDSSIYENVNENYWGIAQIGSAELKDSVDGKFGANTTGVKAGAAVIKKENLKAGIYAGYDFGETSQKTDKAEFSFYAFQVGGYASLLSGNINFKALSAYKAITVKAKDGEFSSDFGINNINFGLSAELQTGKIWSPYISLVGSNISSDEILQSSDYFNFDIDANSYFTLTSKAGVQVKTKAKSVTLRAKGFLSYVLIGNDPEFDLTLTDNANKETIASSVIPSSEQPLFFGIEGGIDLPLTRQIALAITAQTAFNSDSLAYQATVGAKYNFFGGRSKRQGRDREPAEQNGGQEQGTYVATFDTNSSDLSQDALLVISNVAQSLSGKRYTAVRVRGFAPDSANESANRTLSGLRARAVARELQRYGIDRNKIKIEAYGSRRPRFPTGTLEGNVKNQRVEIDIVE